MWMCTYRVRAQVVTREERVREKEMRAELLNKYVMGGLTQRGVFLFFNFFFSSILRAFSSEH